MTMKSGKKPKQKFLKVYHAGLMFSNFIEKVVIVALNSKMVALPIFDISSITTSVSLSEIPTQRLI